jgi:hypothetical protein
MADRLTKIELRWCKVCDKQLGFEGAIVENIANGLITAERKNTCERHPTDGSNVRVLTYMLPLDERESDGLSRAG